MSTSPRVQTATPYLCVRDAARAIEFYRDAFGAELDGNSAIFEGKIGHASLRVGDAVFFLADEFPDYGVQSPQTLGACTATIVLQVDDLQAFVQRATAAGAHEDRRSTDDPQRRIARLVDPFGQRWLISGK